MKDPKAKLSNIIVDYLAVLVGWGIVLWFRWKMLYRLGYTFTKEWNGFRYLDKHFYEKWFLWAPILSIAIFAFAGAYAQAPFLKSRVKEIYQTFLQTFIVSLLLFFLTLLKEYSNYWHGVSVFVLLWFWLFTTLALGRTLLLQYYKRKILTGDIDIPLFILGNGISAVAVYESLTESTVRQGYECVGYAPYPDEDNFEDHLERIGLKKYSSDTDFKTLVTEKKIRIVLLAPERSLSQDGLLRYVSDLSFTDVDVLRLPEDRDFFSGNIQTEDILSVPMVRVNPVRMPIWQRNAKRVFDVCFAVLGMVIASPLLLFTAVKTKFSSSGKIIFRQERLGKNGKPFTIFKFRSMYENAEAQGPQLSSDNDERITDWGKVMRKWRLDELPQLWNIFKGDMSFVGPRPERAYYMEQLSKEIPYYNYLLKVKPGLTSWGMVKYGYASNLTQMKERLKFDLVYLDNASLLVDMKIMIYTVRILFLGKGK